MGIIAELLPGFSGVWYDTGTGSVELRFEQDPWEPKVMLAALARLVNVAVDEVESFLRKDRDELESSRVALESALKAETIDLRRQDSEMRLRELIRSI